MSKAFNFLIIALLFINTARTQSGDADITDALFDTYESYREGSLIKRRIKHNDIQPLIDRYSSNPKFTVKKVGTSIEGRELRLISIGSGETDVFLWSQMHGDEPTATQAIFDILRFLDASAFETEKQQILSKLRLHFLPMLNPDGAEVYLRRNALGIDLNRDALRLQSPEGQTLKRVRDSLDADFGFNLHDQSIYYNAERTPKPATISYLAPAYNYDKDINEGRGNAMRIIVYMNNIIQKYAPGQVGRYNDDFEPRAFGDNIQKWGTSTILIESGGFPDDAEKQFIRKLNYVSILSAINTIAHENYKDIPLSAYEQIPENDRQLFDLKIEKATYNLLGKEYLMDLGIQRQEIDNPGHEDFWYKSSIADLGDLSTFYGYEELDASGYLLVPAKAYAKTLSGISDVEKLDARHLLRSGIAYVRLNKLPPAGDSSNAPLHLVSSDYKIPALKLYIGFNPTFFLQKDGVIEYAVINGFLIDLNKEENNFKNALIYK